MRVRVLGAGIIGLACAEELLVRGHAVEVVDPAPGLGASHAAAGMLSPSSEVWHGEEEILRHGMASLALWPDWAGHLGVPLATAGTLLVGRDAGDLQEVERQVGLLAAHGHRVDVLAAAAVRRLEPTLSARVAGGALLPRDHSVDPRAVVAALLARVSVRPVADATTPDVTVVATGARLPAPWTHLVHGVRGEVARARTDDPPARTVRGWVHGVPVYVVPRRGGEVVIGATSEEHDAPPVATIGGIARLLEAARELVPGLDRAELTEVLARDRPATAGHLPLVGPTHDPAVVLAAGHFRHGVLLAPLTARLVADHLDHGLVHAALDPRRLLDERIRP
ncbi:glycine oxidase [Nocardioides ginsengisegetis]|uniref:Glycine oxidase n=1 Tax=Nocardioides ginsengisegetis TaxID=661491 RepID=A0A7W3IXL5_9ACTN|nr:FAD-dependent oxidoreductase [Nocardioides ginsengisegetis]MBA8802471.1 glycine oxidase [Nocardioides ginsengisegetis]